MTLIIYADLLFLINFFSDFIIIFLTGLFSGTGLKPARTLLSAAVGSLCATFLLSFSDYGIYTALFVAIFPFILCYFAFGKRRISTFGNLIFYFYFSSVLLYGGMYAMMSVFNMFFGIPGFVGRIVLTLFFALAALLFYFIFRSICQRSIKINQNRVEAELSDGIKTYNLTLLVDSGNMVKDPFSSKPVAIISSSCLDKDLLNAVTGSLDGNHPTGYNHIRPRVIPIKTVSGTALLYAFIPQSMYIYMDKKKYNADCIIAIDNHENQFFGKDGIIPSTMLETL